MLLKIRRWAEIIFVISFAVLGLAESLVLEDTITLFKNIQIPDLTRFVLPILTISAAICWGMVRLIQLGKAADCEDDGDEQGVREITTKQIIQWPTVALFLIFGGLAMLDSMQDELISWQYARPVYSYGILWLYSYLCINFILEFIQGIKGFPEFNKENNKILKKFQTIDGLVSSIVSFFNLYLLVSIGNMSVCKYSYFICIGLFIYRVIRYYQLSAFVWLEKETVEISDIDKKEGIK